MATREVKCKSKDATSYSIENMRKRWRHDAIIEVERARVARCKGDVATDTYALVLALVFRNAIEIAAINLHSIHSQKLDQLLPTINHSECLVAKRIY